MSSIVDVQRQWFDRNGWPLDLNAVYAENEFKGDDGLDIVAKQRRYMSHIDGGPGSGNWGHVGRPGERGGSGEGGGVAYRLTTPEGGYTGLVGAYKENEKWNSDPENQKKLTEQKKANEAKPHENILRKALQSGNASREDFEKAETGTMITVNGIGGYGKGHEYMRMEDGNWIDVKDGYIMTSEEAARSNVLGRVTEGNRQDVSKSDIDDAKKDLNDRLSKASDIDDVEDVLVTVDRYPNGVTYTDKNGRTYVKIDDGKWVLKNEDGRASNRLNMLKASEVIGEDYATQHGIEPKSDIRRALEGESVWQNDVEKWDHKPTETEIIETISGGDLTKGSCASLSLAYCANKAGDKVLDFRDGVSRMAVATQITNLKDDPALNPVSDVSKNEFASVHRLQKKMAQNKEYVLITGEHAAIVRKIGNKEFEYLELQSSERKNTWYKLDDSELSRRFGCSERRKYKQTSCILDAEAVGKSKEVQKILPYINTEAGMQKKGAGGGEK